MPDDRCKNCGKRYPQEVRSALQAFENLHPDAGKIRLESPAYSLIPKGLALPKRWGQAMRIRRDELGLSQMAVADRLGVSQRSVSGWENGDKMPSIDTLAAIANALEISPAELFRFEE